MQTNPIHRPRGAVRKEDCILITCWVPDSLAAHLDTVIKSEDTDRSKFLRRAIRHALENHTTAAAV